MEENPATPHKASRNSPFSRIVKWMLWLFGAILSLIFLVALLVFLLPRFVSTNWAKEKAVQYVTRAVHRPVGIHNLSWTWDRGILVEGLEIGDDPSFSDQPILSFKRFLLSVDYRQLLEQRLAVLMELSGAHVNLIKKKDGLTNLNNLLSGISQSPALPAETETEKPRGGEYFSAARPRYTGPVESQ